MPAKLEDILKKDEGSVPLHPDAEAPARIFEARLARLVRASRAAGGLPAASRLDDYQQACKEVQKEKSALMNSIRSLLNLLHEGTEK